MARRHLGRDAQRGASVSLACDACERFRQQGGIVLLLSNSPRPRDGVAQQLDRIGVPRASWDLIVSSGDVARTMIERYAGRPVLHLGPVRDLAIFEGLTSSAWVPTAPMPSCARVCLTMSLRRRGLRRDACRLCEAAPADDLCQPRHRGRAGWTDRLLRRCTRAGLRAAWREGRLRGQALSADLRACLRDAAKLAAR